MEPEKENKIKEKNLFGYPEGAAQIEANLRTSKAHTVGAIKIVELISYLYEFY